MSKLGWKNTSCAGLLLCAATAANLFAQHYTTLHSFDRSDGASPHMPLVQATDGNLYGTTPYDEQAALPYGTVFRITPGGTFTPVHDFCKGGNCADGQYPFAPLTLGADGNLYCTTGGGGTSVGCQGGGCGTIFKITTSGQLTTLYSFCSLSGCTDGAISYSGLIQASDGNYYGTTTAGGSNGVSAGGYGTVFRMTPAGALTTFYSFCSQTNCDDGDQPWAGPVQGIDGNLYGTTLFGGTGGDGTVFKITLGGTLTTLYSFCSLSNCTDGKYPYAPLIQASDGNFYGTTFDTGTGGGGTAFRITPFGTLTTIYSFCSLGNCDDGEAPAGGLLQATDGYLYGTTFQGGNPHDPCEGYGCGVIFRMTLDGSLSLLYDFCHGFKCLDGDQPWAGLVQGTSGLFYGTTTRGGTIRAGTVFSLNAGLGPFVETVPSGGNVGSSVTILGTNLTGAISVTFNGTPATFTVEASSVIKATVPPGATNGTVQVVTPSVTLSSNVPFRVAP